MLESIIQRDLQSVWHPCTQMKDFEKFPPFEIKKAKAVFFYDAMNRKYFDAISSWWCKSLGHSHPRLQKAIKKQLTKFEHVITANTVNPILVELSERLLQSSKKKGKVFYAGDGSTAVEIALKMSLHSRFLTKSKKHKFASLKSAYHGESLLCLAVSDLDLYNKPYQSYLPSSYKIQNIAYVASSEDALWHNAEEIWVTAEKELNSIVDELSAIIVEPIVQGAGGMLIYSKDYLSRLARWCKNNDVHLIADEIMTGMGRTGELFAMDHAKCVADFVCLSKGLTSGFMAFSAVIISEHIFQEFYDEYDSGKSFLHSNTFSGNALAASIALETLKIFKDENIVETVKEKSLILKNYWLNLAQESNKLENIRHLGFITAGELKNPKNIPRLGYHFFHHALKYNIYIRPLSNTIYWFPPLNTTLKELSFLFEKTRKALLEFK